MEQNNRPLGITEVVLRDAHQSLLATRMPDLQAQLFRLLSQDIGKAALLAGDYSADQRIAAFLIALSRRYAARGFSAVKFNLTEPSTCPKMKQPSTR